MGSIPILKRKAFFLFLLCVFGVSLTVPSRAASVPAGFTETIISAPAGGNWNQAVGLTFDSAGRMYVWERFGRVWIKDPTDVDFSLLLDISEEVGVWQDHGLLGFALDPEFRVNGRIYLLYVVDRHHLLYFGTPNYNPNSNLYDQATIGRLTRYTCRSSDNFRSVDPASRAILIGSTKTNGFAILSETHGIGSLLFAEDGTLLVSCGDGASPQAADTGGATTGSLAPQGLADGIIRPKEDIGAYRSQLLDCLSGKLLRIDPTTGNGISSNPFYDPANPGSARSRVWALGLRNPFRVSLRPETGSHNPADGNPGVLYLGDVGYNTWEELDVITGPGRNFGWPVYEGLDPAPGYDVDVSNLDAANPLYPTSGCSQYFSFLDLFKQDTLNTAGQPPFANPCNTSQLIPVAIPQFLHTRPVLDWNHSSAITRTPIYGASGQAQNINIGAVGSPVSGSQFRGNCAIGGTWYVGSAFPAQYQNSYFFGDWGQALIKRLTFDSNNKPLALSDFASNAGAVVCFVQHPTDGSLYYVSYTFGDAGTVRRIAYTGNRTPVAAASANQYFGTSPLTVQFSSSGSSDPDGQNISYSWNFGDGSATSSQANPSHTFSAGAAAKFTVTLTVTDSGGLSAQATLIISVNNTPPNVTVTNPLDGSLYPLGPSTPVSLTATVSDESADNQLLYQWQVLLHHNDHNHVVFTDTNHLSSAVISSLGCDGINIYYYRFILTVTDPFGLSTTREVRMFPDCGANTAPTISNIPDQTAIVGVPVGPIAFTIGDAQMAPNNLQLSATSSNPTLVPVNSILFDGSGGNRTITVTPAAGQSGSSTITVIVTDGPLSSSDSFVLTAIAGNTAPTISSISNRSALTNTVVGPINFTVGDAETAAANLAVTGSSSNPTLIPNANIVFGGSGANRTVTVTPAANQTGTSTITLTVSDGTLSASTVFTVTITASNGLVAAYSFNEGTGTSVGDSSGNGNVGSITAATWTTSGKYGGGLSFNGTTARVNVNDSASLRLTSGMTLEAWINPSAITAAWRDLIYKGDDNYYLMATSTSSSRPALGAIFGASTYGEVFGTAALAANTWTHLAGTYDGTTERLYVNGVQVASRAQTGNIVTSANPLSIGGDSIYGQYFSGVIDDVRIYNRALAAAEIQSDMNTPVGGSPPPAAPTISDIANQSTTLNTPTPAIGFTVNDTDTPASSLVVTGSSANTTLVPNANIVFGGSGNNRTVTVTPATGQTGTATITVTVSDGSLTANDTFVLTVSAVNTAPTISNIADQTINEDTSTGALSFTVGDAETAAGSLTVTGGSSNTALVPNANIVFGGSGANRTVTITPAANQSGSATITVTVSDGSLSAADTFVLTVNPVNDTPTISNITDQFTSLGTAVGPISFTIGDVETAATSLTLSGSSSSQSLLPNANIVFGGSGANRTVTVTPAAGQTGTSTVTVTVSDGNLTASDTFILNVSSGTVGTLSFTNAASISIPSQGAATPYPSALNVSGMAGSISNVTVSLRGLTHTWGDDVDVLLVAPGGQAITLMSDAGTGPINNATLTFSASAAGNLPQSGSLVTGAFKPTDYQPADVYSSPAPAGPYGTALSIFNGTNPNGTWSLFVLDDGPGDLGAVSAGWSLTITTLQTGPAAPTISDIANQSTTVSTPTAAIPFTINDADTPASNLVVTGSSANIALVPNANIVFGGSGNSRTVTVTPAAGQTGTATITVTVSDGTLTASDTFVLTVNAVNTAPTISNIANQTINEDASTGALNFTIGDAETVAASLILTSASSNTALVPNANIVFGGSGANRTVTVTPAANQSGSATITVTVSDGSLSASDTLVLTVNPVNDAPTISNIANQSTSPGTAVGPISFTIGDVETAAGSLTMSGSSSNTGLVPNGNIVFGGSGANRTVTVTPAPGQTGSATITVTVSDGVLTANDTFVLTVAANSPPAIAQIPDQVAFVDQPTIIKLELSDAETPVTDLQLSLSTTDGNLIRPEDYMFRFFFVDNHRYLTMAGAFGQTGRTTNTVTVSDGTTSASTSFVMTVLPPPAGSARFANSSPFTIPDAGSASLYPSVINVSGMNGPITNLNLTVSRLNHEYTADLHMLLVGPNGTGIVFLSHAGGGNAITNVTFTVSDSAAFPFDPSFPIWSEIFTPTAYPPSVSFPAPAPPGPYSTAAFSNYFGLSANGPWSLYAFDNGAGGQGSVAGGWSLMIATAGGANQPPTISDVTDQSTAMNTATAAIPVTVGDTETAAGSLILSGSSSNTGLVPNGNIVFGGSGANRSVTVTPATGQTGSATITMTVSDGTLTATDTFVLTVLAVNTAPTISDIIDRTINEDASVGPIAFTIGDAQTPAGSLTLSGNSSNPTLVPVGNIVFGGSGGNRTVTVTPAANQSGSATITVTVGDGSLSALDSFVLTVNPVNDAPTISNIADQSTSPGTAVGPISFTVGDVETGAASLTLSGSSSNQSLLPNANIVFSGSGANRTVTLTPTAGQTGTSTVMVTVSDGGLTAVDTFVLGVSSGTVGTLSFTNAAAITIPSVGNSTPYPSLINVSGMGGVIDDLTVSLRGVSHSWISDVDILLVSPSGQSTVIFSDVGVGRSINNVTINLADSASAGLTAGSAIVSGTFKPSNVEPGETGELDLFSSPAPAGPYSASLAGFDGVSPNGNWSLYVVDDGVGDQGQIANGWSLTITTVSGGSLSASSVKVNPLSLTILSHSSTQLMLQIGGSSGNYRLEDSRDLNLWSPVNVISSGVPLTAPIDTNGVPRFFRVVRLP